MHKADLFRAWSRILTGSYPSLNRDHARMFAALPKLLCLRTGTPWPNWTIALTLRQKGTELVEEILKLVRRH